MTGSRLLIVVAVLLLIGAAIYFVSGSNPATTPQNREYEQSFGQGGAPVISRLKEFNVVGGPFWFRVVEDLNKPDQPKDSAKPAEIRVKKGDVVRINFKNTEGNHDLVIDEFEAKTKQIQANQTETIEFVADQAGEFEYYCSVGNGYHRQQGMVGMLIVEE